MYLPQGTILNNRYVVENVLGHGGFGITYSAYDKTLNVRVAIKEYLPRQLATRAEGQTKISIYTGEARQHYQYGLRKFLEEAQSVAQFAHHPNIVSARDYFEAHGTAYMVMEYVEGVTLKEYLEKKGGRISFEEAQGIMMPVMDALREVHQVGLMHRDISPDNIYITSAAQVKVLDFGAARYAAGEQSKSLSVILKPGYAPEEQYRSSGKQGSWTDVYAVGATIYKCITGKTPPDALDRKEEDTLEPPSRLGVAIPAAAEQALLRALAVSAPQRFKSMEDFQQALLGGESMTMGFQPASRAAYGPTPPPSTTPPPQSSHSRASSQSASSPSGGRKSSPAVLAVSIGGGVLGLLLLVGALWWMMGAPSNVQTKAYLLDQGIKYLQGQEYEKARSALEEAKKIDANDPKIHLQLALAYNKLKLFPQEIKSYQEAVRLEPGNADAHYSLGLAYLRSNNKNAALAQSDALVKIKPELAIKLRDIISPPNPAKKYLAEGIQYLEARDFDKARIALEKSLSHDPKDAETNYRLGLVYAHLGRNDEAVSKYKQAINIKPEAAAYLNMGLAYSKLGQHQQSLEAMKKAIELNPKYALAHYNLGATYISLGKKELAQKEIDALKGLDVALAAKLEGEVNLGGAGKNGKDLLVKGMAQLNAKDYEKAMATLEEAVRLDSQIPAVHINLALAYRNLKQPEKAINSLKEAIRLKPDEAIAHNNLGVVYLGMEKPQEAAEALKEAIRLKPDNASAHFNLGCSYLKMGKKEEALQEQSLLKNQDQKLADNLLAMINKASPSTDKNKPSKSTKQIEREIQRDADRILERQKAKEKGASGGGPQVASPGRPPAPAPQRAAPPSRPSPSPPPSSAVIPPPKRW